MPLPRGIRASNPGNIRKSLIPWQGQLIPGTDPDFCTFSSPEYGIRAIMVLLRRYYYVKGLVTIKDIIGTWAPSSENNTSAYVTAVASQMHFSPTQALTICPETYISFAQAVAIHENGMPPINWPALWYSDQTYKDAYNLTVPDAQAITT